MTQGVECESDTGTETWHKKCYRQVWLDMGYNDPFAPEPQFQCAICQPPVDLARSAYVQHVKEHEIAFLKARPR